MRFRARLDQARSAATGGAGLGLAIVLDIVRRHHGTIVIDPQHQPGARFIVTLPTAEAAEPATDSELPLGHAPRGAEVVAEGKPSPRPALSTSSYPGVAAPPSQVSGSRCPDSQGGRSHEEAVDGTTP